MVFVRSVILSGRLMLDTTPIDAVYDRSGVWSMTIALRRLSQSFDEIFSWPLVTVALLKSNSLEM